MTYNPKDEGDNSSSTCCAEDSSIPTRSVSFADHAELRVFERVLADHPTLGPSLGLGWNYVEERVPLMVAKETRRTSFLWRQQASSSGECQALSPQQRTKLAKKHGFTSKEIKANTRQGKIVLLQRELTLQGNSQTIRWNRHVTATRLRGAALSPRLSRR